MNHQSALGSAAEEAHHDVMFKHVMHLACTAFFSYYACVYKYSWLLKPRFSRYFARGSEGLSRLKGLLFEDEYRGAEDWAELQGYIGEPLARSMVDALNEGRKYKVMYERTEPLCQVKSLDVHAGHVTS